MLGVTGCKMQDGVWYEGHYCQVLHMYYNMSLSVMLAHPLHPTRTCGKRRWWISADHSSGFTNTMPAGRRWHRRVRVRGISSNVMIGIVPCHAILPEVIQIPVVVAPANHGERTVNLAELRASFSCT